MIFKLQAFPGESVTLSAVALDEYSHNTSAFLRLGTTVSHQCIHLTSNESS